MRKFSVNENYRGSGTRLNYSLIRVESDPDMEDESVYPTFAYTAIKHSLFI